jgi:hypothetical protein
MKTRNIQFKENKWHNIESDDNDTIDVLLVFTGINLLENNNILSFLASTFKNAQIISCTTAGEINQTNVEENSIICSAIYFEKTPIETVVDNLSNYKNSFEFGVNLGKKLNKENLTHIFMLSDGNLVNGDDLLTGIKSEIGTIIQLSGGIAGDGDRFQKTYVGLNEDYKEGNVVLMGLYGNNIHVGTGKKAGWDVFGPEKTITKSEENFLHEIDGENALDMYKTYLGKYASELPASALLFPISIKTKDHDFYIVRTILSIDNEKKVMKFAGNVPEGSTIRFMKSNFDRLVLAASEAGIAACENMGNKITPEFAIIVSCVGRKLVLANRIEEEVEAAVECFPNTTNVIGFFSYGEISPQKEDHISYLHNQTITITTFSEHV